MRLNNVENAETSKYKIIAVDDEIGIIDSLKVLADKTIIDAGKKLK